MIQITKTEIIQQLVEYEINWLRGRDEVEMKNYLKDIFLNGFDGFSTWSDDALFSKCVDVGIFLMEE